MSKPLSSFDLQAWKHARALRKEIAQTAKDFPSSEKYRLIDQIVRSSRSIPANIAEGFGRHHHQESSHFYRQARGSLVETMEHITCAWDEGYIDEIRLKQLMSFAKSNLKIINGLIKYVQSKK